MERIGVVYWDIGEGMALRHTGIAKDLGYEPVDFFHNQKIPEGLDMILLHGPWGSMAPLGRQLASLPVGHRPKLAWWFIEPLPNPSLPEWFRYHAGRARSWLERVSFYEDQDGSWKQSRLGRLLTLKGARYRYYGDLYWFRDVGILTVLVNASQLTRKFLIERGFKVLEPLGPSYYPEWGADLNLERDIPVVWIGRVWSKRRRRLLEQVQEGLSAHGIDLLRIDGEYNPPVYNQDRTILLNRSKIVLNLLREKWDNNFMRFQLAALNRAMVITEPMLPHTPFVDGVHMVEAPVEDIPDQIVYYLNHEEERAVIAERAYQMMTRYTRQEVIAQIIDETLHSKVG